MRGGEPMMGKAYVVEYYDNLANSYLELYGSESLSGYHKAAYLVRRGGSRVLDLGCGMGGARRGVTSLGVPATLEWMFRWAC